MFITLTDGWDEKIRFSVDKICTYYEYNGNTKVVTLMGEFTVKETPKQIDNILTECYITVKNTA